MPRRSRILPPLALVAALLLAACGSPTPETQLPPDAADAGTVDSTSTPGAGGPAAIDIASLDACAILTRSDAEAILGLATPEQLGAATADVASCGYTADPNGPVGQVELYVGPGALKQLEIDRDVLEHVFTQPTGIGDEAWLQDGMIFARAGETWFSIRVVSLDDPARFVDPLQTAARDVAARLDALG